MIRAFTSCRSGNVAMMFGLLAIPMLSAVGIAFDMIRANHARAIITESADAGLLAAARSKIRDAALPDAVAAQTARNFVEANMSAVAGFELEGFSFANPGGADRYVINVDGRIRTSLLSVIGRDWINIDVVSEADVTPPSDLEVALVLDNTYSMTGSKMTALKSAADDLVETIMAGSTNVKVGLVPFSQYVNVGLSRRNAPWIDVPADYSTTQNVCRNTYPNRTRSNCVTTTETCTRTRDGVTTSYQCNRTRCDVVDGDPVWACADQTKNFVWSGCVGSRNAPLDVRDEDFAANPAPGLLNTGCAREITPLTTNKAAIKSEIAAMSVQGDQTYIPAGLSWGYRLLSSTAPFTEGVTYTQMANDRAIKAVVLMSDGKNTRSADYSNAKHTRNDGGSAANDKVDDLCNEAKSKGIRIYTIAFEVTDASVRNMLEDCASASDQYYNATDAAALSAAFNDIGNSLYQLALSK